MPEFYRKNFRNFSKRVYETYSDFAVVLNTQFKRWVSGLKAYDNVEKLRQVMLIEQFVEKLPADIRLWLSDKDINTLSEVAKETDIYVT